MTFDVILASFIN